jgi:UDP-N-acetylglucosamine--N-acetylmuramyl-(pentapeptide) pyrophosphoryl-undecaprenol N-acetylglucosamine transferase
VRPDLFNVNRAESRAAFGIGNELPVVVVYGGSRGARSVNRAIAALLPDLLALAHVIHVCGREGDETWLRAAAERVPQDLQARYHLFPYLHSGDEGRRTEDEGQGALSSPTPNPQPPTPTMVQAFGAADLAIARSGASTLAELPAAKLPAVLVPYPYVHQDENADYLVARGAAVKVADAAMLGTDDPKDGALWLAVQRLLNDHAARAAMAERSAQLARSHAADAIAGELLRLAAHGGAA